MNIYIPKHLRQIEVIDDVCRMLENYSSTYYEPITYPDTIDDPVRKFLALVCDEKFIDYFTRLFYSVKGTIQVLSYMKRFLGYELTYKYSTRLLQLKIEKINLKPVDEGTFRILLTNFLNALLYFKELDLTVDLVNMHLDSKLPGYTGLGVILYNTVEVNYGSES